jgi:hypothetical protein
MSRIVGNDCVLSEHVNFLLCTNPLMRLFWVGCGGSFQGSREEDDIIRSRRMKSLSLGMPTWFIPAYFKKTQASKFGDAHASPSSSTTYQVTSSETIFLFGHILCALLGASVCFYFRFVILVLWINRILSCLCGRETHSAFSFEHLCSSFYF